MFYKTFNQADNFGILFRNYTKIFQLLFANELI